MFVIPKRADKSRKLFLVPFKLVYHSVLSLNSCSNVSAIRSSFKRFLALVVRAKARHVKPITNIDHNVRFKIVNKLTKPSVPFVAKIGVSVTVRNYQVRLRQFE